MWLKHEQCEEVAKEAWETGGQVERGNSIESYLENCRIALTRWNSRVFGHMGKNIGRMQKRLQTLEEQAVGHSNHDQILETRKEQTNYMLWRKICGIRGHRVIG